MYNYESYLCLSVNKDPAPPNSFSHTWLLSTYSVLEKNLESPLGSKDCPVNPKGNQPWIFIGKTNAEAEAPVLLPLNAKCQLIGKDPDAGKDWGQEEKGMTEDGTVGWHHWLKGHEFEQSQGDGEGQRSLMCCSPWGCKELDTTKWLNNNNVQEFPWVMRPTGDEQERVAVESTCHWRKRTWNS